MNSTTEVTMMRSFARGATVASRLGTMLALVLALTPIARPASAAPSADTVRVAFQPIQSHGGLFIAERDGYFAAERIKIEWVQIQTGGRFVPLLAGGHLDVGAGAVSAAFFTAVAADQRVRVVADKGHINGRGTLGSIVVRRDLAGAIRTPADLRDRRVSISGLGGLGHYVLGRALSLHRVPLNGVSMVVMPNQAMVPALQSGGIDAAVLPVPFDGVAVDNGIGVRILDLADLLPGEPTAFLFYGSTLLDRNRALGLRFMTAYLRALRQYNDGPTPRNVAIVADYTKVDAATIRAGGWIGIHADGFVDAARLRRYQDWLFEIELISVRNPLPRVVDPSFVEQARAALGLPGR
jgi:NitT/TauT family transport system substrate-binding protein